MATRRAFTRVTSHEVVMQKESDGRWTVTHTATGDSRRVTAKRQPQVVKALVDKGMQLVWSEDEMRFLIYGRHYDVPDAILVEYRVTGAIENGGDE